MLPSSLMVSPLFYRSIYDVFEENMPKWILRVNTAQMFAELFVYKKVNGWNAHPATERWCWRHCWIHLWKWLNLIHMSFHTLASVHILTFHTRIYALNGFLRRLNLVSIQSGQQSQQVWKFYWTRSAPFWVNHNVKSTEQLPFCLLNRLTHTNSDCQIFIVVACHVSPPFIAMHTCMKLATHMEMLFFFPLDFLVQFKFSFFLVAWMNGNRPQKYVWNNLFNKKSGKYDHQKWCDFNNNFFGLTILSSLTPSPSAMDVWHAKGFFILFLHSWFADYLQEHYRSALYWILRCLDLFHFWNWKSVLDFKRWVYLFIGFPIKIPHIRGFLRIITIVI